MNVFNTLSQENQCDEDEIKTKNQLRNCRKRLKKLEAKDISDPILSEENERNIHILRVKIEEYLNKNKGVSVKKKKEEQKKEDYDEDAFLDEQIKNNIHLKKEYEKNEKERQRRFAEEQEEKRRKDEELRRQREEELRYQEEQEQMRKKKEEQYRKQRENWEKRYTQPDKDSKKEFFAKFKKEDGTKPKIPKSFFELYENYDHKKFRVLSLKYHGDKPGGCYTLQRILNCIKDLQD
jgi:hypothetical protein